MSTADTEITRITRLRLDGMPLPLPADDSDKDQRGVVLVIGGSTSVPGAVLLSGVGALRAGAGKLQIGTVRGAAIALGIGVPEALVLALPTTKAGEISGVPAAAALQQKVAAANAVLIGPGMTDHEAVGVLLQRLVPHIGSAASLVLDGAAAVSLRGDDTMVRDLQTRVIITPHAGEMASLLEIPREDVLADPAGIAQQCANRFQAVVVLKGGETYIAHPSEPMLHYRDGKAGLGTSGSGDVLAGIITGLAARGAPPQAAAAWGVWAHGSAGNKLSRSVGKLGFLASELLREVPGLVND